jgi:nucleoid-associated protein YgaU
MTREAKIGLLMVAVLVGVFGFLIYKRVNRPTDISSTDATMEVTESADHETNDVSLDQILEDDSPNSASENSRDGREIKVAAHNVEAFTEDPAEETIPSRSGHERRHQLSLPTDLSSESDDTASLQNPRERNDRDSGLRSLPANDDASNNVPGELPETTDLANSDDNSNSDPFEGSVPVPTIPATEYKMPADRHAASELLEDDSNNDTEVRESKSSESKFRHSQNQAAEADVPEDEPTYARQPASRPEFSSRGKRQAAPISVADDETSLDANVAVTDEQSYTIQQNDSFWSISKKRYGVGRYYMALALHNQRTIPDPKKMKLGVVIATPDVSVLERLYGDSIPKVALDEASDSITTTQTRHSANSSRSGFFLSESGEPMYRIGQNDTLTDIAKNHLRRSSRWVQIREMNRNVLRDGNELKTGTVLRLPADASPIRVERTMEFSR